MSTDDFLLLRFVCSLVVLSYQDATGDDVYLPTPILKKKRDKPIKSAKIFGGIE